MSDAIKVLVIDDSAYNRQAITAMLSRVPGLEVVARASDGNEGLKQVAAHEPDVITLDLEMPKMDGYTFLRILMTRRPTPVIVISSHSERDSVFKALELGALDFVAKPAHAISPELRTIEPELVAKITAIGKLRPVHLAKGRGRISGSFSRAATVPAGGLPEARAVDAPLLGVVCIAASTGGPPALKQVFEALPPGLQVAALISQHMPASFTGPFARRLDDVGPFSVREAKTGDRLEPGVALVAPGSGSIVVEAGPSGARVRIEHPVADALPKIVPNADRMMESAALVLGSACMGVVLTGMGDDGARGTVAIRRAGGFTVAEAERTAVIFGMPDAAIRTGKVDEVVALDEVAAAIVRFNQNRHEE